MVTANELILFAIPNHIQPHTSLKGGIKKEIKGEFKVFLLCDTDLQQKPMFTGLK